MWFSFTSRRAIAAGILFSSVGLFTPLLNAQLLQGTLDGNVIDSSQAAMAGARVTATDQATSFSRSVLSAGRFGTCGTNSLSGPGLFNVNLGVNRDFRVTERFTLSFRGDMFNAANTPHHVLGNTSVNASTFMQAVGILNIGLDGIEQRAARLSLRLGW